MTSELKVERKIWGFEIVNRNSEKSSHSLFICNPHFYAPYGLFFALQVIINNTHSPQQKKNSMYICINVCVYMYTDAHRYPHILSINLVAQIPIAT